MSKKESQTVNMKEIKKLADGIRCKNAIDRYIDWETKQKTSKLPHTEKKMVQYNKLL